MRHPNTTPKICDRVFVMKSYEASLYKWSPACNQIKKKIVGNIKPAEPNYCDATPGSQGQDWQTTYVYNVSYVNNQFQHLAYVECDYVQ